jgi:hypothetical protein
MKNPNDLFALLKKITLDANEKRRIRAELVMLTESTSQKSKWTDVFVRAYAAVKFLLRRMRHIIALALLLSVITLAQAVPVNAEEKADYNSSF